MRYLFVLHTRSQRSRHHNSQSTFLSTTIIILLQRLTWLSELIRELSQRRLKFGRSPMEEDDCTLVAKEVGIELTGCETE